MTWRETEPVRVIGGRIPDFLGGDPTTTAERILAWPSDCGSIRDGLAAEANRTIPATLSAALQAVGILDEHGRFSSLGSKLTYHLDEYRRQGCGDGALNALLEEVGLGSGSRLLEVGCGAGQTLLLLGRHGLTKRVGLDIDLESLALGWQLAHEAAQAIDFVRGSATALPFSDGSFSHVLSRVTLNYVHQRTALGEQVRVLRPGGFLYCRAEGPGYDLLRLARARQLRPLLSFAYDLLLGLGLAVTGRQATPGRFPSPGRACATLHGLRHILVRLGCTVLRTEVSGRYAGLPAAIDVLAQKTAVRDRSARL